MRVPAAGVGHVRQRAADGADEDRGTRAIAGRGSRGGAFAQPVNAACLDQVRSTSRRRSVMSSIA